MAPSQGKAFPLRDRRKPIHGGSTAASLQPTSLRRNALPRPDRSRSAGFGPSSKPRHPDATHASSRAGGCRRRNVDRRDAIVKRAGMPLQRFRSRHPTDWRRNQPSGNIPGNFGPPRRVGRFCPFGEDPKPGQSSPSVFKPITAADVRFSTPSLRKTCSRCLFTVRGLMSRMIAISRFDLPLDTQSRTSA